MNWKNLFKQILNKRNIIIGSTIAVIVIAFIHLPVFQQIQAIGDKYQAAKKEIFTDDQLLEPIIRNPAQLEFLSCQYDATLTQTFLISYKHIDRECLRYYSVEDLCDFWSCSFQNDLMKMQKQIEEIIMEKATKPADWMLVVHKCSGDLKNKARIKAEEMIPKLLSPGQ